MKLKEAFTAKKAIEQAQLKEATIRFLEKKFVAVEEVTESPEMFIESVEQLDNRLRSNLKSVPETVRSLNSLWSGLAESVEFGDLKATKEKTLFLLAAYASIKETLDNNRGLKSKALSDEERLANAAVSEYLRPVSCQLSEASRIELKSLDKRKSTAITLGLQDIKQPVSLMEAVTKANLQELSLPDWLRSNSSMIDDFNKKTQQLEELAKSHNLTNTVKAIDQAKRVFEKIYTNQQTGASQQNNGSMGNAIESVSTFIDLLTNFLNVFKTQTLKLPTFQKIIQASDPNKTVSQQMDDKTKQQFIALLQKQFTTTGKGGWMKRLGAKVNLSQNPLEIAKAYNYTPQLATQDILNLTGQQLSELSQSGTVETLNPPNPSSPPPVTPGAGTGSPKPTGDASGSTGSNASAGTGNSTGTAPAGSTQSQGSGDSPERASKAAPATDDGSNAVRSELLGHIKELVKGGKPQGVSFVSNLLTTMPPDALASLMAKLNYAPKEQAAQPPQDNTVIARPGARTSTVPKPIQPSA